MPIAMAPINYAHGDVVVDGRDLESLDVDGLRRLVESQREHIQALQNDLAIANGALRLMKDYGPDHHNRRISHPLNAFGLDHEQSHEFMSNRLIGQIEQLRRERGELCYQVEAEEEFLMNSLQKRLDQVQREKVQLEMALEQAQESLVMSKLKMEMDCLKTGTSPSSSVASPISAKMAAIINSNAVPFGSSRCSSTLSSASGVGSPDELQKNVRDLQAENSRLLMENIKLSQQLRRHGLQPSNSLGQASVVLSPGAIPLRRSDSGMSDHSTSRSGSISDLRLAASHSGHRLGTEVTTTDDEQFEDDDDDGAILSISPLRPAPSSSSKHRANSSKVL